nr:OmcA/MtrC family decaheme c-type cytochrome [uncultured Rhodoferax sp.]
MKTSLFRWGTALLASLAIAGCGGGGGGSAPAATTPAASTAVSAAITAAAATPLVTDTATGTSGSSAAFTVLQAAGVPAVTINSPPVVNFTVFSDGAVYTKLTAANVSVAMAKLVPASNGNPDEWVSYVTRVKTSAVTPNGLAVQGTTDPKISTATKTATYPVDCAASPATLTYNPDGYYTYKFCTDVKKTKDAAGNLVFDASKVHRVALQLSYTNKAGTVVKVNPYFDFTINADGTAKMADPSKTRKMTDVNSCNSCHETLALHGGGRVDTQFCVMCHNPGSTDAVTGKAVTLSTMVHKLHAGKRLAAAGDPYIVNDVNASEIGFPQDLRNCTKCHTAANPATPQGDNWKTAVSQQACLTCHTSKVGGVWETKHVVYAKDPIVVGAASATNTKATDLTNAQCIACHKVGSNISSEVVHWNQNEENSAKYKMNIEGATYDAATRKVTVKYFLSDPTNGNAAYDLVTSDCASTTVPTCSTSTKFGNLRFYVAYQTMVGQSTAVTEFSSYNNGGSGANAYAYKGTKDASNHYTVDITLPADTATSIASGTARVISIGQVKEPQLELKSLDPRPAVVPAALVSVVVQNTHFDVALTGALQPRRAVVSSAKCNACHGSLGSTSGSNTLANAFHGGARDTVEACSVCHDANRSSSGNMMTNGLALYEPYQFKRMIHGIHGNSKRMNPFTHGNKAVQAFCNPTGTTVAAIDLCKTAAPLGIVAGVENYAAEVAYPGVGLNCNACHVNNSYKNDQGTLGAVVMKPTTSAPGVLPVVLETDPNKWLVISPKAASCTACHDSSTAMGHVANFGGASFGNKTQAEIAAMPRETCNDCHASGGFKGVDVVHGQK